MKLTVIGPGCSRCKALAQVTDQAAKELGVAYEMDKVTDVKQMIAMGVMATPALAVDGAVKLAGRVPSLAEVKKVLA